MDTPSPALLGLERWGMNRLLGLEGRESCLVGGGGSLGKPEEDLVDLGIKHKPRIGTGEHPVFPPTLPGSTFKPDVPVPRLIITISRQ